MKLLMFLTAVSQINNEEEKESAIERMRQAIAANKITGKQAVACNYFLAEYDRQQLEVPYLDNVLSGKEPDAPHSYSVGLCQKIGEINYETVKVYSVAKGVASLESAKQLADRIESQEGFTGVVFDDTDKTIAYIVNPA